MNYEKILFPENNFSEILTAITSAPFLAEKRLVVVK
jgi:hypothetical protein